jgi:uncharacterized protein (TIGR00730 family)
MKSICVFCAASPGFNPLYRQTAAAMGAAIARAGMQLVYGGGVIGLMGALADGALAAGGQVIGVIPDMLMKKEVGHRGIARLEIVHSMHERKSRMSELADAFIAMPGGYGTFEEFCEVLTWAQLGLHSKPCCLLNTEGFFDPFLALIDRAVTEGFIKPDNRGLVTSAPTPQEALAVIANYAPPAKVEKVINLTAT